MDAKGKDPAESGTPSIPKEKSNGLGVIAADEVTLNRIVSNYYTGAWYSRLRYQIVIFFGISIFLGILVNDLPAVIMTAALVVPCCDLMVRGYRFGYAALIALWTFEKFASMVDAPSGRMISAILWWIAIAGPLLSGLRAENRKIKQGLGRPYKVWKDTAISIGLLFVLAASSIVMYTADK